jgi:hypothetical protein
MLSEVSVLSGLNPFRMELYLGFSNISNGGHGHSHDAYFALVLRRIRHTTYGLAAVRVVYRIVLVAVVVPLRWSYAQEAEPLLLASSIACHVMMKGLYDMYLRPMRTLIGLALVTVYYCAACLYFVLTQPFQHRQQTEGHANSCWTCIK